ncbi:MAG: hypothetical protein NTW46_00415 [Candidatus Nealsonbacteria bacterium]|nr:hypothetical protein [Candidatus Nealsonbacteria bacterium]
MLKTRDGFRLSSRPDYDPKYGGQYKAMTSIMAQEYQHWKKTGKMEIPPVQEGQYFDRDTGESIVWYAERRENEIFLSSLPGYDQLTGTLLKPISREIVKKYEKYLPKAIKGSGGNQAKKETSKIQSVSSDKIKSDAMDLNNYKDRVNVRVDLSWYFSSPSIYEVDSSVALYVEKNQRYRMYSAVVEKIISSPPFIIIGVCFTPYYVRSLLETEAVLLDGKDGKYKVIKIITELDSSGNKLVLKGGQEKRVLYVFNNVEIIELDCGVLYLGEHWYSSQNKMMPRVYAHNEEVNGRRYGEIPISHLIRNVDVYKRIDEDGIVHFSSIPGPGWKLVIREQAERKPNLDVGRSIIPDSETEKLGKGTEKPLPNQEETTTKKIYKLNFIKFCKKH